MKLIGLFYSTLKWNKIDEIKLVVGSKSELGKKKKV